MNRRSHDDLRGNRRRIADDQGRSCSPRTASRLLASGQRGPGRRAGHAGLPAARAGCWPQAGVGRSQVRRIVATGYGRNAVSRRRHDDHRDHLPGGGVRHLVPAARTIIDIGGQDSKLLRLDGDGRVRDFAMNDRCAAGTGRFLEVLATRLGVPLGDLGPMAARSRSPAAISSMCVVFAETEIIGLLASGRAARTSWPACRRLDRRAGRRHGRPECRSAGRLHRRRGPGLRAWTRPCRRPSASRSRYRPSRR